MTVIRLVREAAGQRWSIDCSCNSRTNHSSLHVLIPHA